MGKRPSKFGAAQIGAAPARSAKREPGASVKSKRKATRSVKPVKVIRDSFTIPAAEHRLIGALKKRCIGLGVAIKKSELLRAGLAALERLPDEGLAKVVAAVESVKTGRPPGKKKKKKTNRAKRRKQVIRIDWR
jgi:hypothetical protein